MELTQERKFEFGFGVGFFVFYPVDKNIKKGDFVNNFKNFLNKQTNISNIIFDVTSVRTTIEFIVYLPQKNQKDLIKDILLIDEFGLLKSEQFFVKMVNCNSFSSVIFIKPIGAYKKHNFSDSVIIIRKYFEDIIKTSNDIHFKIQGPSPAHLELFVFSSAKLEDQLTYEYSELAGYDSVNIIYNPDNLKGHSIEQIISLKLAPYFNLYYSYEKTREDALHKVVTFLNTYALLLKENKKIKFWDIKKKYFNFPEMIRLSWIKLAEYEISNAELQENIQITTARIAKSEYQNKLSGIVKRYMEGHVKLDIQNIPTKTYYDTLTFLENRHLNYSNLIVAFLSAIIGGAIGSIISLLCNR